MNSNGTRFLLLDGASDFRNAGGACSWDAAQRAFTLTRRDTPRLPAMPPARARELLAVATPFVLDDHGQLGRLSDDGTRFECTLTWPPSAWQTVRAALDDAATGAPDLEALVLDPVDAPAGRFIDLDLGGSGLVALPWSDGEAQHGLTAVHLRRRWQTHCTLDFAARRAWVESATGADRVWLLGDTRLGLAVGAPLPQPYAGRPERFEPLQPNPDPLRLLWDIALPPHGGLLGLAADAVRLAVLAERPDSTADAPRMQILSRPLVAGAGEAFRVHRLPDGLPLATDIAATGDGRFLLLMPFEEGETRGLRRDCALIALPEEPADSAANAAGDGDADAAELIAERWPRRSEAAMPAALRFVRHRDGHPRTLTADGPIRLYRLAQAHFDGSGTVTLDEILDSAMPDTLWDRICIDACIPPGCRLDIALQTGDDRDQPPAEWIVQPQATLTPGVSELAFAPGRAPAGEDHAGRAGLYELLIQRSNGAVREVRGRYLRLRITMQGDGRHSPAIFALRVWYPRFSWQTHYLPDHFQQQERPLPLEGGEPILANGADFRERLLASFDGLLTPLEDRIAAAEILLDPAATPAAGLPWLSGMLGTTLPGHWPEPRRRRWLASQGAMQQTHGSYRGLLLALDILTEGSVARGAVIPVEHFRLRRTMATILGIDMDDRDHPLTLGTGLSGNSIVGDSLILSDDQAREFLALFAPDVAEAAGQSAIVERFFDDAARRMTVILHGSAKSLAAVVRDALPFLVPATVQWTIRASDHPFVLGLSPLLGIDTWLETQPPPGRVVLERTRLGRGDLLHNPIALDPEHAVPIDATATDAP
jgi:phage tail-like protein